MAMHQIQEEIVRERGGVAALRRTALLPGETVRGVVQHRERVYRRLLVLADALSALLALFAATLVGDSATVTAPGLVVVPLAVLMAKVQGLYDRDASRLRKTTLDEAPKLFQMATLFALMISLAQTEMFGGRLGAKDVMGLWISLFAGMLAGRTAARRLARTLTATERCLFIGEPEAASRLSTKLLHEDLKAEVVARLTPDQASDWLMAGSNPGMLDDVRRLIRELDVHRVVLAPYGFGPRGSLELVRTLKAVGVRVSLVSDLFEVIGSSVEFDDVHGLTVLGVRNFSLSRSSRVVKRAFDLGTAIISLMMAAPLFALAAAAIRLDSPGPVFFRQERVGRGGRRFWILKFRTMVVDADAQKGLLQEHNQGADGFFKIANDPRVTRVGRLLRRTSLDELPQLVNVLHGEMSIVGPRPLIAEEDRRIVGWHRRRLELTPGITGHWQVLGSSRVPLNEMVALDYLYVANWSPWNDVKLLLRTVPHVLGRRGL